MERKIEAALGAWRSREGRKPLLLLGCRQCGKTYSVKQFGKSYASCAYINFETDPSKKMLFDGDLDPETLLERIMLSCGTEFVEGDTLLIFDEVQLCPGALSSLKAFKNHGFMDIVALGSFLGVYLGGAYLENGTISEREAPVGYVDLEVMHPMDFEEFCWAMGVNKGVLRIVKEDILAQRRTDGYFDKVLNDLFRRYIVIGGMPEVVSSFSQRGDYSEAVKIQGNILAILKADAGRYSSKADRAKIIDIMDSIPMQLAAEKGSFEYGSIPKARQGYGRREYGSAIHWLELAGIAMRSYNLTAPDAPLSTHVKKDSFRLFMCDTGLLMSMMDGSDAANIVNRNPESNNGPIMENAIASVLRKKGYALRYYSRSDSTLEIDFVIDSGGIVLIEVKSGGSRRSKALSTLMAAGGRRGIKVAESQVSVDEKGILHLPLYGPFFLPDSSAEGFAPADVDGINRHLEEIGG